MTPSSLERVAQALVAEGKGILAADESLGTIEKRFRSIDVPSTEESRRAYREILFTTAGAEEFISGVILFDETARQQSADGTPFVELLAGKGILPGIKVDRKAHPLAGAPEEKVTEGLDGLRERLAEYRGMGLRFAKWRAVLTVGEGRPSDYAIAVNAHALARYAALALEQDLVPIVEPEVLMDGDHTLEACFGATERTLRRVFAALHEQRVPYERILLKPNMVLPGKGCPRQATVEEVAEATLRCFARVVPAALPGIVFLSGGQSDEQATAHLNAMNLRRGNLPWQLSFSYGRALQAPVLKAWRGRAENADRAREAFHHRAALNGAARFGRYTPAMEAQAVAS